MNPLITSRQLSEPLLTRDQADATKCELEGRKAILLASRGKIAFKHVLDELKGKPVGSFILRNSRFKEAVIEFCYVAATCKMERISLVKRLDGYRVFNPSSLKKRKFAKLDDIVQDPEVAKVLKCPVKPPLPEETFHKPASITLIPFSRANLAYVKQVFDQVKQTFEKKSEVALTFDEQTLSITFPYNEHEMLTILDTEALRHIICGSCTLTRTDLTFCVTGSPAYWLDHKSRLAFLKKAQKLDELAKAFFLHRKAVEIQADPNVSLATVIPSLLKEHQGFCIGERHKEKAAKKFVIDNMHLLKQQGVTTLFMEHLFYDSTQSWLDRYVQLPEGAKMPIYLENYLQLLSDGQTNGDTKANDPNYNYVKVVQAAKEAKIRVVAIDTTVSYLAGTDDKKGVKQDLNRYRAMNYVAAKIITQEKGRGKFVALMGSAHVATVGGQMGVSEVLGCPSVVIENRKKQPSLQVNVKNLHEKIAHVSIYMLV